MLKYGYMKKAAPLFNRDKGATIITFRSLAAFIEFCHGFRVRKKRFYRLIKLIFFYSSLYP